jgi:hypothetical protein
MFREDLQRVKTRPQISGVPVATMMDSWSFAESPLGQLGQFLDSDDKASAVLSVAALPKFDEATKQRSEMTRDVSACRTVMDRLSSSVGIASDFMHFIPANRENSSNSTSWMRTKCSVFCQLTRVTKLSKAQSYVEWTSRRKTRDGTSFCSLHAGNTGNTDRLITLAWKSQERGILLSHQSSDRNASSRSTRNSPKNSEHINNPNNEHHRNSSTKTHSANLTKAFRIHIDPRHGSGSKW